MKKFPIYVGGQFVETSAELEVTNPYDQASLGLTYQAGEAEFEQAVKAAEKVKEEMAQLPVFKRYEILRYVADKLEADKEALALILAAECGKPYQYSVAEIERAAQTFLTAAEEAKRLPGEIQSIDWAPFNKGKKAMVQYFPVGLVAGIAPFNFPMNLVAHKVAPAIAAGCPLVLKPASSTPLSALKLAGILDETDLPKGALSVMPMDRTSGNKLVTDSRFNLLSFTGSPGVGWQMKKEAGKKKVVLELGGNAGAIVTADTDMTHAVKRCLVGGFSNNGQSCIHTQRIYVHESQFENFKTQFIAGVKALKIGAPTDKQTELAGMIDQKNADRIKSWIEEAIATGAQLLVGGEIKNTVVMPTVLTNTNASMKCAKEEVFGPVVTLESYSDFESVVEAVNNSDFGLQAGLFSDDWREINYAYKTLEVGGLIVNDVPTFRADHQPYGGVKDSGIGREGPKYAILDMMEPRVLMLDDRMMS